MRTYRVSSDHGVRTPIFQIESAYIGSKAIAQVLMGADGVANVVTPRERDIVVRFDYLGRPFIVWEPFADNSRYWIGPADMVQGEPEVNNVPDTTKLEELFQQYRPPFHRAILAGLVNLGSLASLFNKRT